MNLLSRVPGARRHRGRASHDVVPRHPDAAARHAPDPDALENCKPIPEISGKNIEPVRSPVLILVGTADRLMPIAVLLHDALAAVCKSVRLDISEGGYHDFCLGTPGQNGPICRKARPFSIPPSTRWKSQSSSPPEN